MIFAASTGDARQGLFEAEAVGGGDGGFEQHDAGLRHVVLETALQRERDAGVAQLRGRDHAQIFGLAIGTVHGGMQDDRTRRRL